MVLLEVAWLIITQLVITLQSGVDKTTDCSGQVIDDFSTHRSQSGINIVV